MATIWQTFIRLAKRYREQLAYLIVGVATTLINFIIYTALVDFVHVYYVLANVIAWVVAVTFSYFANGTWVYQSSANRGLAEASAFVTSRLLSLGVETVLLWILVSVLHVGKKTAKILVAVIVVVMNYLTGLVVFKRKKKG